MKNNKLKIKKKVQKRKIWESDDVRKWINKVKWLENKMN